LLMNKKDQNQSGNEPKKGELKWHLRKMM